MKQQNYTKKYHATCDICTGENIFHCDYKIRIFPTLIVFNKISYTMYHDAIKKTHNTYCLTL